MIKFYSPILLVFASLFFPSKIHDLDFSDPEKINHINFEAPGSRYPIFLEEKSEMVEICNLTPGETYYLTVSSLTRSKELTTEILYKPKDGTAEKGDNISFVAKDKCAYVSIESTQKEHLVYLSVATRGPGHPSGGGGPVPESVITTNTSVTPVNMVTQVFIGGNCFEVTGVTYSGQATARGTFANGATSIQIDNGIELATGNLALNTPGPNNNTGQSGGYSIAGFDTDLDAITGGSLYDVAKLEFNFKPTTDTVKFEYVFASEEYCDYVGSQFNDVFGFFISGPGITGTQNIALIPGTSTPVTINNVNHVTNNAWYTGNIPAGSGQLSDPDCAGHPTTSGPSVNDCQFDGFTKVLTAFAIVQPCQTYHIKLAIADVGDGLFDSAVFLKANSFDAGGTATAASGSPQGSGTIYEGCTNGFFTFTRQTGDPTQDLVINFTVGGTATNGVDYSSIPSSVTIPGGQNTVTLNISVIADLIPEGTETITLTFDNPCNCSNTTVTLSIVDPPPLLVTLNDQTLCGNNSATLTPSVSGGIPNYTYSWSSGGSTSSINVTPASNQSPYTVTVSDNCGHTATETASVTFNTPPSASISGTQTICGAAQMASLTINLTGNAPWVIIYAINGVPQPAITTSTTPYTLMTNMIGNYTLVSVNTQGVTGCPGTVSGQAQVTQSVIGASLTPTTLSCFGGSNGSINLTTSGGTSPFHFNWNPGSIGDVEDPTGLTAGNYSVTVTDNYGCTTTANTTITAPTQVTASVSGHTDNTCTSGGSINLSVSGGTPNYTFSWNPGGSSSQNPTNLPPGDYTVTVTDSHGCTTTQIATVIDNSTPPVAEAGQPFTLDCNHTSGQLNGTGSSTGPGISYQWTGGGGIQNGTTLTPTINQPGTYSLVVTNSVNGCKDTDVVVVPQNITPPTVVITTPLQINCSNPTITLDASGSSSGPDYNLTWTTSGGHFVSGQTTLTPIVDQAGTYTLNIVNSTNGCQQTQSVTVTGNATPPTVNAGPDQTLTCTTQSLSLNGSGTSTGGTFSYQWTTADGHIVNGGTTLNPSVDMPGTYILTVINSANGCSNTDEVTIGQNITPPIAEAGQPFTLDCTHTSGQLNGTGSSTGPGISYQWTGGGGIQNGTTLTPTINQPGTYSLVVTNSVNGCKDTDEVVVPQNITPPTVVITTPNQINCNSPTISIDGSGSSTGPDYTINWTTSGGHFVNGQNTLTPEVDMAGTYTLTITNSTNGCTQTQSVTVTGNTTPPTVNAGPDPTLNCTVTSLTLNGAGTSTGSNYSYQWTTADGHIVNGGTTLNPLIDMPGTYILTVVNSSNQCTSTDQVTVNQNITPPVAEAGPPFTLTCTQTTGQLNGNGSSTGPGMNYQWSGGGILNGGTTLTPTIGQPDTYQLIVTNSNNGCRDTDVVVIPQNIVPPVVQVAAPNQIGCNSPTISLDASGSSSGPGFNINWTTSGGHIANGQNTLNPVVDLAGTYTLTITNSTNGCTQAQTVTVVGNTTPPNVNAGPDQTLTCSVQSLNLNASGTSTGSNFTYQWTTADGHIVNGGSGLNPLIDMPGTYVLTVVNGTNQCVSTDQVTVGQNITQPTAEAGPPFTLTCILTSGQLNGAGSSTGAGMTYQWSTTNGFIGGGGTTLNPTVSQPGNYQLIVTNTQNGCQDTDVVVIPQNIAQPTVQINTPGQIGCNSPSVTLNASGSSSGGGYNINWSTLNGHFVSGTSTLTPVVDVAGTYTLVITNNSNGCTQSQSINVTGNIIPPNANAGLDQTLTCSEQSMFLSGTGSSTGSNFTYQWSTTTGHIVSGGTTLSPLIDAPGNYVITVLNTFNQCFSTDIVSIGQDITPPTANAGAGGVLDCDTETLTLNGSGTGSPNLSYSWTATNGGHIQTGGNTASPHVNAAGTYILTVTNNQNGCTATSSTVVTEDINPPTIAIAPPATINCSTLQVTINASGSTSGPFIGYLWSTANGHIQSGATTNMPVVTSGGLYFLTVTNNVNACTAVSSVTVPQNTNLPEADAGSTQYLTCTALQVQLNGSGSDSGPGITYQWSTTNGHIVTGGSTLFPTVDQPGTYTLTVFNSGNGCSSTSTTFVQTDANVPFANAGPPQTLDCNHNDVYLNGTSSSSGPNFSYQWTTADGHIVSGGTTNHPLVDAPGTYVITVLNTVNGCSISSTTLVTDNAIDPTVQILPPNLLNCVNNTVTLDGSGSSTGLGITYAWTTSNGHISSGGTTNTAIADQPGNYTLTIHNNNNGCVNSNTVTVTQNLSTPNASIAPAQMLTCTNTLVTLNAASSSSGPNLTLNWSTTDGNFYSGQNTLTPIVNAAGTYTLLITNNLSQCTATASITVQADANIPVANAGAPQVIDCNNVNVFLNGTNSSSGPGITYHWSTTDGHIVSGTDTNHPLVDAAGIYMLTVNNINNGCSLTSSTNVTNNTIYPTVNIVPPPIIDCATPTVNLNGTSSSSGPGISYSWTTSNGHILTGGTTNFAVVDHAGNYTLTISNSLNGCTSNSSIVVNADLVNPNANIAPPQTITCTASTVTLNASGSSVGANMDIFWNTTNGTFVSGDTTLMPVVSTAGIYTLLITNNQNHCTATASVTVPADLNIPTANAGATSQLNCTLTSVQLNGAASGGNNLQTVWTTANGHFVNGSSTLTPTIDAPGNYLLTVTNPVNNCVATSNVTISQDIVVPNSTAGTPSVLTCSNPTALLNGNGSSVGGNMNYQWVTNDGHIVLGANTLTPTVDLPGTYTLTVLNQANTCSSNASVTITQDQVHPVADAGAPQTLICSTPTLQINGSGSSSGGIYTYSWSTSNGHIVGSNTVISPVVDQPGLYQLTVQNINNGCNSTAQVQIGQNIVHPVVNAAPGGLLTCTELQLNLSATATGNTNHFVYTWTTSNGNIVSGGNSLTPLVDDAGNYLLTVEDTINHCTSTASTTVQQDANVPQAAIVQPGQLNCTFSSVTLNGSNSSSGGNFVFAWATQDGHFLSGINSLTPVVDMPGTYVLSVTNTTSNCVNTSTVLVISNVQLPVATIQAGIVTCANPTINLQGVIQSPGNNYGAQWQTTTGVITANGNTLTPTVSSGGHYTLSLTNFDNGCNAVFPIDVQADQVHPTADAGLTQQLNCQVSAVTLSGAGSSTGSIYSYLWTTSNGNLTGDPTSLNPGADMAGTYQIQVNNSQNGCTSVDVVSITQDIQPPVANAGQGTTLTCATTQYQLNGAGSSTGNNFTYNWTTANGTILSGATTQTPIISAPGLYQVQVTNTTNHCTNTATVAITQNIAPPVAAAGPPVLLTCTDTLLALSGSSTDLGVSCYWTTSNGNIVSGGNTFTPLINAPGSYQIHVVRADNGCESTSLVAVTQDATLPVANAGAANTLTCAIQTVTLDGSGSTSGSNIQYHWSTSDGAILSGDNTVAPVVNEPGSYLLIVTNMLNNCHNNASVTVHQDITPPIADAGATDTLTCSIQSLQLDGTGSSTGAIYSYQWSTNNGNILSGGNTMTPMVNSPGVYQLQVNNMQNGCSSVASTPIMLNTVAPVAAIATPEILDCNTLNITINGSGSSTGGGFGYAWSTSNGHIVSGGTTLNPVVDAPGTYSLLITNNNNGCTTTSPAVVTQDVVPPTVFAGGTQQLNCTFTTLTLSGTAAGSNNLTYQWSTNNGQILNGGTTLSPQIGAPGIYRLTVINQVNGCTNFDEVPISQNIVPPVALIASPAQLNCVLVQTNIDANSSSNGPEFSYLWSTGNGHIVNGDNTLTPAVDQPGVYTLTILNSNNGCTQSAQTTVTQNVQLPVADAGNPGLIGCTDTQIPLDGSASSGSPNLLFHWTTVDGSIVSGAQTANPSVDNEGLYTLTVTNPDNGCTQTDQVQVLREVPQTAEVAPVDPLCHGENGSIVVSNLNGGTPPFVYSIDGGGNFYQVATFSQVEPGIYPVVVQDAHGCEYADTVSIIEPIQLELDVNAQAIIQLGDSYQLNAEVNVPHSQIQSILWAPSETLSCSDCYDPLATPLNTTQYRVTATNLNGCPATALVTLIVDKNPHIYVPNAFSPNGDDINDIVYVFGKPESIKEINVFRIYDRWGEIVHEYSHFQPNDIGSGWDGKHRGQIMDAQVFVWYAEVEFIDGRVELFKGDITLVR